MDKIKPVTEVEGTPIDQVFIGSCTNGRLEDLEIAAKILEGKKVADYVSSSSPASRYRRLRSGILETLIKPEPSLPIRAADSAAAGAAVF